MKTKEIQWAEGAITDADNKAFTIWTHPDPNPMPPHWIFERRGPDTGDRVDFQRFPAGGCSSYCSRGNGSYQTLTGWYDDEKGCLVQSTDSLTYSVPNQYVLKDDVFVQVDPFRRS